MTESKESTKHFFWVKLEKDFFQLKEIKKLRKLAAGDIYTLIFFKMQLLSLDNNQNIYFDNLEDDLVDELALAIDENPEDVGVALSYFLHVDWIEKIVTDTDTYLHIIKIDVGSECSSTARVRKHRAAKKQQLALQCNANVTAGNTTVTACNKNETIEETETETETEKKQQPETKPCCVVDFSKSVLQVKEAALKLQIPPATVASLIHSYGLDRFKKQLDNLQRTPNIRNNVAWLRSALEKNYKLAPSLQPPVANPDCPNCHGTGKIQFAVGSTNETIFQACSCLQQRDS